jgi:photosystem II stability/assembly factor-like uncharacterized protein
MYFADNLNGWIVANEWGDYGLIFHTGNGGNTWEAQDTTLFTLYTACFFDVSNGFIAGEDGKFYRTVNGGVEWTEETLPYAKDMFSSCRINGNLAWLSGEDGALMYSSDGGISWVKLSSGINMLYH